MWRWLLVLTMLLLGLYLLNVAGGMFFVADSIGAHQGDPDIKDGYAFWGTVYFVASVVLILGSIVLAIRNVIRSRKASSQ